MYAVIQTGGKQYTVSKGRVLKFETLSAEPGETVDFNEVLFIGGDAESKIGSPLLQGAKVTGKVISHGRAKKIHIFKHKRRKHHTKRMGHRQNYTEVEITDIQG